VATARTPHRGSGTDAALGLEAFAVFNQLFGAVSGVPADTPPVYAPPKPDITTTQVPLRPKLV